MKMLKVYFNYYSIKKNNTKYCVYVITEAIIRNLIDSCDIWRKYRNFNFPSIYVDIEKRKKMNKFSFFVDLSVVNQSQSVIFDNGKPTPRDSALVLPSR